MTATSVRPSLAPRGVHLRRYRKRRVSDNFRPVAKLNIAWEQVIEQVTEERVRLWGPRRRLPPRTLRTPRESLLGGILGDRRAAQGFAQLLPFAKAFL